MIVRICQSIVLVVALIFVPEVVFGWNYHDFIPSGTVDGTLEGFFGDVNVTELVYENSKIILTQSILKTTYKTGEPIIVNSSLLNTGNHNVTIYHWTPTISSELKNNNDVVIGTDGGIFVLGGNVLLKEILKPRIPNYANMMPTTLAPPDTYSRPAEFMVTKPGNYTITSVAWIRFDSNYTQSFKGLALWSVPLHLTVLPEKYVQNETYSFITKIPEFPFAIPILLISIVSVIVFYRIKFGNHTL